MSTINCQSEAHGERWSAYHGDCVVGLRGLPDESIDFSVYSPPFAKLYIYSESEADMGNCDSDEQFLEQYAFCVRELFRVVKPGRLVAVHCQDITRMKCMEGDIGIKNLSGRIVDAHEAVGWIYHSRVTIWKDPVVEQQRTKALGLLYKQLRKDSAMSRVGIPDYLLLFRKPGKNPSPVAHTPEGFPLDRWQEWASPVWMTVRQTNVLSVDGSRSPEDEKHVCPLQLDVIERALTLWSNPGDVVVSPFMGIGSEGYGSLRLGRKFVGFELKEAYWKTACGFLAEAEATRDLALH